MNAFGFEGNVLQTAVARRGEPTLTAGDGVPGSTPVSSYVSFVFQKRVAQ